MSATELLNVPDSPSKVSNFSEDSIELSIRAYSKIILHAAKYPHCAVNGVLLAKTPAKGQKISKLSLIDAIPLFHQNLGLTPMIEVALTQIEAHASGVGMAIAGFYHANENFKDSSIDVFSQRIADRIADLSVLNRSALLTVDNRRLGLNLANAALIGHLFIGSGQDNTGKWKTVSNKDIRIDDEALEVTSALLHCKAFKNLVDFDNHLDDVSQDYLNVRLNMEIDRSV